LKGRGAHAAERVAGGADLAAARAAFEELSGVGVSLVRRFGHARPGELVEVFCPKAFENRGATWLQEGEKIRNPYFGPAMPDCGEIRDRFPANRAGAPVPASVREGLSACVRNYLDLGDALAADDLQSALAAAAALEDALAAMPTGSLESGLLAFWREAAAKLRDAVATLRKATDLEAARRPFALLSDTLVHVLRRLGHAGPDDLVVAHCPMAFSNRGADWIQRGEAIHNPYFGSAMPRCGDVTRHLTAEGGD